jgi:uncharacterized protein (DUF362 family)
MIDTFTRAQTDSKPIVSIARIKNGQIELAVEEAVDLLGGIEAVTQGKQRILLKPNLVIENRACTTKPEVVRALGRLMIGAGKDVSIGEGSAVAYTRCRDLIDRAQQQLFDRLGYTAVAKSLGVPLLNLHTGPLVTVPVAQGLFWRELVLHQALVETDLLCSVAMMKTHWYATVTLALKNVIGLYPGSVYGAVRWWVHDNAYRKTSPGVAFEILDMVRANKLGFSVIDASTAMEGQGPTAGTPVTMNLIIAGTDPLATDMVAASVMGIQPTEVPTFVWAHKLGMKPRTLEDIEVRGTPVEAVLRKFTRARQITPETGVVDIYPAPAPQVELTQDDRVVVTWNEAVPKAVLQYDGEGKASVGWTNAIQGSRAILERNSLLQKTGWQRITPAIPGRHEVDAAEAAQTFFRLRKP